MSDTPRTLEALTQVLDRDGRLEDDNAPFVLVKLAKTLERELNATVKALEKVWPFLEEDDGDGANAVHYQAAINAVKAVITTKKGDQP